MPVKSTIFENDFKKIISNYNLGEYIGFSSFPNGAGQTTVLISTTNGKYVLRYYENRSLKHVIFETVLFNDLGNNKYPVPTVLKTLAGETIGKYNGKPYILLEFVDGIHSKNPNEHFDQDDMSEVAKNVAILHLLTKQFSKYSDYREVFDTKYCRDTYHDSLKSGAKTNNEVWFNNELDSLEFPPTLQKGINHADLNYGNFLFKNKKVVAVLDFDMSFYWYLVYDIASLIYWWAWPPDTELHFDRVNFILNEYSKNRELSTAELSHVYDALKLIILLGIAWSDDKDFDRDKKSIDFLNKLGREGFLSKITHFS